jgi:inner membrane protein
MPSIYTHGIVGLGLGKLFTGRKMPKLFWLLAFLLPIVPDFDVLSTATYDAPAGHRGLSHSLAFALTLGLVAAVATFKPFKVAFWDLWGFYFVIIASHGILDAFNSGGSGIAFFWPVSMARYGPWGPIPVVDFAFDIPNPWKSRSMRAEILWIWLPLALLVGLVTLFRILRSRTKEAQKA